MSKKDSKIKRRVYGFIDKMKREMDIYIPRENYPVVEVTKITGSRYNPESNTILINIKDAHSGDAYGEEVGHYIRSQLKPKGDIPERLTSEFFGYLGRKILKKVAGSKKDLDFKMNESICSKKEALEMLKKHKIRKKHYQKFASGELDDPDRILTPKYAKLLAQYEDEKRKNILEHHRGYGFANKVDISKLDYGELYSLPNKEVRARFFRAQPQYKKKRSLESELVIITLVSLFFLIPFLNGKITADLVLKNSGTASGYLFLVIGLIIMALIFIKYGKDYMK